MISFDISNINSNLNDDYKGNNPQQTIQRFQDDPVEDPIADDQITFDETYLDDLFRRFLDGDILLINDIDQYINLFDSIPIDSMIVDRDYCCAAFIEALIESIAKATFDQNSIDYILTSLHLFALLSNDKMKKLNDLLNDKFIQKLIDFAHEEHKELVINSLWCISNIIWVSDFAFDLFYNKELFSFISELLSSEEDRILTLCALINQRALSFLGNNYNDHYLKKSEEEKLHEDNQCTSYDPTIIISNLHHLFQCKSDIPKFFAESSIPQIIQFKSNNLDLNSVKLYLSVAFDNYSDDIKFFGLSLSIISELLLTENELVYVELKNNEKFIEILKKGISFAPEPKYQAFSIKSICIIIMYIPELHQKLIEYGIIEDIIVAAEEGDLSCKISIIEAFCRIFFNDDTPLLEEILEKGGLEFLCDSFQFENDSILEVVDALNQIVSKPEPLGPVCAEKLIDIGLIELLEDSIQSFDDAVIKSKIIEQLIYKEQDLKDFLIDFAEENCTQ